MSNPIITWKNISVQLPVPHRHVSLCERRGVVLCPDLRRFLNDEVLRLDYTFEPRQIMLGAARVDSLFPEMLEQAPKTEPIMSLLNQREKPVPVADLRKLRRLHAGLDKNFGLAVDELIDGKPFIPDKQVPTRTYQQIESTLIRHGARPLSPLEMASAILRLNLSDPSLGNLFVGPLESDEDSWWRIFVDSVHVRGEPRFLSVSQSGGVTRVQHNGVRGTQSFAGSQKFICAIAA